MGPPASSGDATTGKAKKVKSEELVSSHGVLDASSVFQNAIAVKTLSDDLLFGRPAEAVVTLCRYDGSYVVVKRDHLAGSDTADMEAIYHKLLAMPALECFLKPLAFEFDYARSQVRTVWPLIGTPSTVCLDLIRFVMPSGKPQDVVPLSVDELAMFVVDMSDALNALHDAGIRRSAVEPANIFVEFQVATRSTPRSVRRFVLADNRRERLFSVPEAADRLAVIDVLSPRRRDAVKTRSDVYDFGACLLWLITKNSSLAYLDDTPPPAALARFIGLAQACMHPDVPSRPSLRQLLDLVSEASPHT